MEKNFKNLAELQAEIEVLKVRQFQQEEFIKDSFKRPMAVYHSIKRLMNTANTRTNNGLDFIKHDLISGVSRLVLPAIMNGVFFKRSNVIIKSLVWILSQNMAKKVDGEAITGVVDSAKKFITEKIPALFSKKKKAQTAQTTSYVAMK